MFVIYVTSVWILDLIENHRKPPIFLQNRPYVLGKIQNTVKIGPMFLQNRPYVLGKIQNRPYVLAK
jgi:hypothetical protein